MRADRKLRGATILCLLLALSGCGQDAAKRREQAAAAEEKSLGSRVKAVGDRAQQSVQEGERRERAAVDAAE